MKKSALLLAVSALALASCQNGGQSSYNTNVTLANSVDSASYAIGMLEGMNMRDQFSEIQLDKFIAGIQTALKNDTANAKFKDPQTASMFIRNYMMEKQQKEAVENLAKSQKFMEDISKKEGIHKLDSADIYYEVLTEGTGAKPTLEDEVEVHYTGTLIDGTKFDSSVDRGEPARFPLSHVIKGWTLTLQQMPVGSKWKVYIPSDLGYGPNGSRVIPANSALVFEIELLQIIKPEAEDKAQAEPNKKK
jgi:FKBP-type peptidyl-prolyl cis-trans isomerase